MLKDLRRKYTKTLQKKKKIERSVHSFTIDIVVHFQVCSVKSGSSGLSAHQLVCFVGGHKIIMMIDSGSSVNTVPEEFFDMLQEKSSSRLLSVVPKSDRPLQAYAGSILDVVATFESDFFISESKPTGVEKFYAVSNTKTALLGRETSLRYQVLRFGLDVTVDCSMLASVYVILESTKVTQFPKFKIPPVRLFINTNVQPRRFTYTSIPLAFEALVKERIKDMEESGIIEELREGMNTSFCSALLVVPKGKKDVRLVVDLRGANKSIIREPHNMPSVDKVMASLFGNVKFSTIDLTNAFSHVVLEEGSRHITNFFTGDKFYRFVRLPFGLCNAPDIFQQSMETVLTGCTGIIIYLDDILVFGKSEAEHDHNLKTVMQRLSDHGVSINRDKCQFNKQSCKFLGFQISSSGYQVLEDHFEAIKNFRRPVDFRELRSFLGLMNYVEKFIVNRAEKLDVLQGILRNDSFDWTEEAEAVFEHVKSNALNEVKKLGFYRQGDTTELVVDASPVGLGAVLVQFDTQGKPRIIACASKSLTQVERRYSHTQKEALAMVWGVERFQYYLRGVPFTIFTDAEANEFIFGKEHRLGKRCVTRAEAWALRLLPFSFTVRTVEGRKNIADVFSRLIKTTQEDAEFDDTLYDSAYFLIDEAEVQLTWDDVEVETAQDATLQEVISCLNSGKWPKRLRSFEAVNKNLYNINGVLVLNQKMVVPASLQEKVLKSAHGGHFGMNSMKRMLRVSVWWPSINKDVESFVKNCLTCQKVSRRNNPLPIASRDLPDGPWQVSLDSLALRHELIVFLIIFRFCKWTF